MVEECKVVVCTHIKEQPSSRVQSQLSTWATWTGEYFTFIITRISFSSSFSFLFQLLHPFDMERSTRANESRIRDLTNKGRRLRVLLRLSQRYERLQAHKQTQETRRLATQHSETREALGVGSLSFFVIHMHIIISAGEGPATGCYIAFSRSSSGFTLCSSAP